MIHCTVLTGFDREPAETFIQATSRQVCLSDISDAYLAVSVSRAAFMQVKIEEEVVLGVEVTPETKQFELLPLLTRKKKKSASRRGLLPFFSSLRRETEVDEGPARTFTVMFRDGGATDRVVATYEFHLLEAKTFGSRYRSHLSLVEGEKKPVKFTTDARRVAVDCWNCETPVRPGGVCTNCGCSQVRNDGDGEDSFS